MTIPSQDLIRCKTCGAEDAIPHKTNRLHCVPCGKKLGSATQRRYREKLKTTPAIAICKQCNSEFDISIQGKKWICPSCNTKYMQDYGSGRKDINAERSRQYRASLADVYREKMAQRYRDAIKNMSEEELKEFRAKENAKAKAKHAKLKEQVFNAYGDKCACCGESEPFFLSIDHIDNNGSEMRNSGEHGRGGTTFYQYLRKNNFPDGFQVLCMNCNIGKHRNGGVCPHQSNKV
jgi:hypothetical protein